MMIVNELRIILAGPMVRRVEAMCAYIWITTSKRYRITAEIYKIDRMDEEESFHYHPIDIVSEPTTVRIGKRLFVHLIKITPKKGTFPIETLLGYNLQFTRGSEQHDLDSLHLFSPENPQTIVYGRLKYPTFQIKSGIAKSTILYGSCRKLHGAGEDALAIADSILEKEFANLKNRPDSLFLMGDQIYADNVADPLIKTLSRLGDTLIGQKEPLQKLEKRLAQDPFQTTVAGINGRQFIMEDFCQFTATHAQNHLITLGEFAAMYLLSWSPELWEFAQDNQLFESFNDVENNGELHFVYPNKEHCAKEHRTERHLLETRFLDQQEALITFQESLAKVRRLLANIPTYMIFDDHDITDDWNITANWKKNVWNAPLGRHVVANVLTAYWAFQGWGNDPDHFDFDFIETISSNYQTVKNGKINSPYEKWLDTILNFNSWHFIAPTCPKAVFLDTRTLRDYDSEPKPVKFGHIIKETTTPPQLLSKTAWSLISNKLQGSGWKSETPLIIVSATPVYGMGLIESFLHDYVYPFKVLGIDVQTSFDFEAWKYNGEGFTKFLLQVATWNPSICIILSGDVHYASSVNATVTLVDGRKIGINQYTSSPFKNMSFSGVWGLLLKLVIGLNSIKRKREDIHRICDSTYTITIVEKENMDPYLWKDQLRYQFLNKGSIIETNNNLGLISIDKGDIRNRLIIKKPPS
jgi:hypothetical protein